jgi:hypothetical protein
MNSIEGLWIYLNKRLERHKQSLKRLKEVKGAYGRQNEQYKGLSMMEFD